MTRLRLADRQQIIQEVTGRKYDSGHLNEIGEQVRDAFQRRGYFKVMASDPTITVLRSDGKQELVDVVIRVEEGEQYRLKDILIRGAKVFPGSELRKEFPISAGDIFDVSKIRSGVEQLRRRYCMQGYVGFTPVPDTQIDDAARLISVTIDADEGAVYHVGKLTVDGEEAVPGARTRMLRAWQAYEGTLYDCDVLKRFLRDIHAPSSVVPDKVFVTEPEHQAHIINVRITLAKSPQF